MFHTLAPQGNFVWIVGFACTVFTLVVVGAAILIDCLCRLHARRQLAVSATLDGLTSLPNRRAFDAELQRLCRMWPIDENFAVVAIEIAGLDAIYQQFGTRIGELVIEATGQRLIQARSPGVFLARIGPAQFCGIGRVKDRAALAAGAERLRSALSGDLLIEGRHLPVDVRVAAAIRPGDATDAEALTRRALAALARALSDPLGTIALHDEAADARAHRRLILASDLRFALERDEFCLYYQPQVRIADGHILGYEALLRWQHPQLGMISPAEFIPLAEQNGSIVVIGDWALRTACAAAVEWPGHLRIAVNLSPQQLRQANLPHRVAQTLQESGLDPDRLEIELTESLPIEDGARALDIFTRIKAIGVRLALDDFGKGYSSMEVLRRFPFDKVKLDKSFVDDVDHDPQARAILHAMLALGRKLGMDVLVEGVETERQLAVLRSEGCRKIQGYLSGRPAPMIRPDGPMAETILRGAAA